MKKLSFFLMIPLFLCVFLMQGQTVTSYNLGDGSIFTNANPVTSTTSPDGKLRTQAATTQFHSVGYGMVFKNGNSLEVDVAGHTTVRFYGSVHSAGTMNGGTTAGGNDLGTKDVLVDTDKTGYYEFTYIGGATTLYFTFSGSDAYTPAIDVISLITSYNLGDGSTFTDANPVISTVSPDGKLRTQAATTQFHSAGYGVVFKDGNSLEVDVIGTSSTVRFYGSVHSAGTMSGGTTAGGSDLGSVDVLVATDKTGYYEFTYTGGPTTLYFTFSGSDAYTPAIEVTNLPVTLTKTDVWDFGAEELDPVLYNNMLTEAKINAWYDGSITPASSGNVFVETFTEGILSWTGGTNDRLRTSNTNLTRYDENLGGASGYTGRVYINAGGAADRQMSLTLSEDDEVTIMMLTQSGTGMIHFEYATDSAVQDDVVAVGATIQEVKFVAKAAGEYHIYDAADKPSYYRILRKDANYITLTGSVDETLASGIPGGYSIDFTNDAGKTYSAVVSSGTYSIDLPADNTYALGLGNANGYVISNGLTLDVTETTTNYDVSVIQVDLFTVTGNITGLTDLANLSLTYIPDPAANKIYDPIVTIDTGTLTYSVDLEAGVEYTISAEGVNDFEILANTITISGVDTSDIAFTPKPLYNVTIDAPALDATQLSKLSLTFTNLNEAGYEYNFTDVTTVALRDGVYTIQYDGLDEYTIELGLTSNLTVSGSAISKILTFNPVTNWSFDDKVISNTDLFYKGLAISGLKNEIAKGHLSGGAGSTIVVPMNPGEKIIVSYYYKADFSIEGGDMVYTNSGSTSQIENVEYVYPEATAGTVTITCGASQGTTYFTNIEIKQVVAYSAVITVGTDKDYQTINEALSAIYQMDRPSNERVTVMIDPGNYEEMIVINSVNVTLKNAASSPSIAILNAGVDIDANAVRITSYYGQKYNFYSQGSDNKWHADVLAANKANGYISHVNDEGSTNGSYWNATVVVVADGFTAENIILENSFNQYISQKESEDIVESKAISEPVRPTNYGNTSVQDRGAGYVTQAAAIGIASNIDKVTLNNCRVVGRQDSFYGGSGSRVVVYKGAMMGVVDYIFGAMTAVFYQTDLVLNTSDSGSDVAYVTAAYQTSGRGYLMYECHVKSPVPGVETASINGSKPGYFGRPWRPNTSEVVFYNTIIDESTNPSYLGQSLIFPDGWKNSLGGESPFMYEYGTVENASGVDNSGSRVGWSTVLSTATLTDATDITTFNFTKGNDNWDPIAALISLGVDDVFGSGSSVKVSGYNNRIYVSNVKSNTSIKIYSFNGALVKSIQTKTDTDFDFKNGLWIVTIKDADGQKVVKIITQ